MINIPTFEEFLTESVDTQNTIVIPRVSEINYTSIVKWIYRNLEDKCRVKNLKKDCIFDISKLSPEQIARLDQYLKQNDLVAKTTNESTLNEDSSDIKVGDIVGNTVQGFNFKVLSIKGKHLEVENTDTGAILNTFIENMRKPATNKSHVNEGISLVSKLNSGSAFTDVIFHSNEKHNPNYDIVNGFMGQDVAITYTICVKGPEVGTESMEYYTGGNYVVTSNKRSHSRVYSLDKIPAKYQNAFNELRAIYQTQFRGKK